MSFLKRLLLRRKISRQWAFNVAVVSGDWDKAEALHRRHPDLVFSKALLPTAVKGGRNEIVEWLLANNADVNGMDDENYCALHHAAAKGRQQMVELLLARRADVNLKHAGYRYYNGSASLLEWGGFDDGNMPLHYAAFFGHKEVAELLLAAKAEVNAKEKSALALGGDQRPQERDGVAARKQCRGRCQEQPRLDALALCRTFWTQVHGGIAVGKSL
jgi:hypothetical protein